MNRSDFEDAIFDHHFPSYSGGMHKAVEAQIALKQTFGVEESKHVWQALDLSLSQLRSPFDTNEVREADRSPQVESYCYKRLERYVLAARKFNKLLSTSSDSGIIERYTRLKRQHEDRRENDARKRDRFAFFSLDTAAADMSFWTSLQSWTPEQAIALSFGKDPRKVNPESLKPYRKVARSMFTELFEDRLLLLESAIGGLRLKTPLSPTEVMSWARTQTSHFADAYFDFQPSALAETGDKVDKDDNPIGTRSSKSLYSCLLLLASCYYEHNPNNKLAQKVIGGEKHVSKTIADLHEDLKILGLPLDYKTLRGHIFAADSWALENGRSLHVSKVKANLIDRAARRAKERGVLES